MSNITYAAVQEVYSIKNKKRISYGIVAYSDPSSDDTVTIVASARDISPDLSKISSFVNELNRMNVSPDHLQDVVENFLAD